MAETPATTSSWLLFPEHDEAAQTFGEFQERHGPLNSSAAAALDYEVKRQSWQIYVHRRDNQDAQLQGALADSYKNPRIAAWEHLIEALKPLGSSPGEMLLKANIVSAWVNTAVHFDSNQLVGADLSELPTNPSPDPFQTPLETLVRGGVCTDIALLKYETLRKLGFDPSMMRIVGGYRADQDGHVVLKVSIGNKNVIFNDDQQKIDPQEMSKIRYEPAKRLAIFGANQGNYSVTEFSNNPSEKPPFQPAYSFSENGINTYDLSPNLPVSDRTGLTNTEFRNQYNQAVDQFGLQNIQNLADQAIRYGADYAQPLQTAHRSHHASMKAHTELTSATGNSYPPTSHAVATQKTAPVNHRSSPRP